VEDEETAAMVGARDLVYIACGDRHLAAQADALQKAKSRERRGVPSEGADGAHYREDKNARRQSRHPADLLGYPAEQESADELPDKGRGDDWTDIGGRKMPLLNENRNDRRDGQHVEAIEERCRADDEARPDLPPANR